MSLLNIRQLEAFRAVMVTGSVTAAGELLRVTQPSVSKLIAQLEAHTGMRLFDRVRGRLVPRPEAKGLFLQVDKAFGVLEETARSASRLAHGASGHLRIVSIPAIGLEFLPNVIADFVRDRGSVSVEFNIRASSYVEEWVSNRQADIGFATATAVGEGVNVDHFVSVLGVCVLPKEHRLSQKKLVTPDDLVAERFISLGPETAFRQLTDRVFQDAEIARCIVVETGYSSVACSLVAAGCGIAILDPFSALDGHRKGGLIMRAFRPDIPFKANVLQPRHSPRSSLSGEFLQYVRQRAAQQLESLAGML